MVVAAYLAGLISTPAALLGVWLGDRWWAAFRRAQAASAPLDLQELPLPAPTPLPPQEAPTINRISLRSVPSRRRSVRGSRPK